MKRLINQAGFSALEMLVVVAAVTALGYVIITASAARKSSVESIPTDIKAKAAPAVNSDSDLIKVKDTLNNINPDEDNKSDNARLESEIKGF